MPISSRALLQSAVAGPANSPAGDFFVAVAVAGASSFRKNSYSAVIMIIGVLFAAALCSIGLSYVVHWVLRRSSPRVDQPKRLQRAIRNQPAAGVYSAGLNLSDSGSDCAICLAKFEPGELVRFLPKCAHCFHAGCVDRWLIFRPSCPTCRQCLVDCPSFKRLLNIQDVPGIDSCNNKHIIPPKIKNPGSST